MELNHKRDRVEVSPTDDDDDDDDDDGDCFYVLLFSDLELTLRSHLTLLEWLAFYSVFLNSIHRSGVLTALAWLFNLF